jgi:hypothetical protein
MSGEAGAISAVELRSTLEARSHRASLLFTNRPGPFRDVEAFLCSHFFQLHSEGKRIQSLSICADISKALRDDRVNHNLPNQLAGSRREHVAFSREFSRSPLRPEHNIVDPSIASDLPSLQLTTESVINDGFA